MTHSDGYNVKETHKKIVDFTCKVTNTSGFRAELIKDLQLEFPRSYQDSQLMAEISKAIKKQSNSLLCSLPFCHTVEAEAFGGLINLSDGNFGPRKSVYAYQSIEELLNLPELDFQHGRINEVLKACQILSHAGEKVMLEVSGFLTILHSLIDLTKFFKAWRNAPEAIDEIFEILSRNLFNFFEEAKKSGVAIISYADPTASVNIVGPIFLEKLATEFTLPLLKKTQSLADENFIIHVCPKISLLFYSLGLAERKTLQFPQGISYAEACLKAIGKEKVIGQACINDDESILSHGKINALHFITS